jgi:tetratricopeptide (TPR) repeat protein
MTVVRAAGLAAAFAWLAGCAAPDSRGPAEARALIAGKLPASLADRSGWAADVQTAMAYLEIAPNAENVCAIVAVTEQETGFKVDPPVPGLAAIAWKEIERQRERAGIPRFALDAALALKSTDGRSYRSRIDDAATEQQLSEVFEDFIGRVPLGRKFLEDRNPVRTGGPMQVSIAFAREHAEARRYPYPLKGSVRDEVFTRRGGMYFGIAHLLDYPAGYDRYLYRFADFNAGQYASRNAAFQKAVSEISGIALALDGDLLRYAGGEATKEAGSTESAVRALSRRIELSPEEIRRDLERGRGREFEQTRLYARVFGVADARAGKALPRAVVPQIDLASAKFTRKLTTDWFAQRVVERYRRCIARAALQPGVTGSDRERRSPP